MTWKCQLIIFIYFLIGLMMMIFNENPSNSLTFIFKIKVINDCISWIFLFIKHFFNDKVIMNYLSPSYCFKKSFISQIFCLFSFILLIFRIELYLLRFCLFHRSCYNLSFKNCYLNTNQNFQLKLFFQTIFLSILFQKTVNYYSREENHLYRQND